MRAVSSMPSLGMTFRAGLLDQLVTLMTRASVGKALVKLSGVTNIQVSSIRGSRGPLAGGVPGPPSSEGVSRVRANQADNRSRCGQRGISRILKEHMN